MLVTLQALWGDYTDYGYVYAMANAIASQLGWETDPLVSAENDNMDACFRQNPEAITLLYPVFTECYATDKIVQYA